MKHHIQGINAAFIVAVSFFAFFMLGRTALAADLPVTSNFGWRLHPVLGYERWHCGVDLGYEEGTQVLALYDGQAVLAGDYDDGYGIQVMLYHSQWDIYTRYAHMMNKNIEIGEYISAGQVLGWVGDTGGNSTGPHLHLEYIAKDMETGEYTYVDPLILFY